MLRSDEINEIAKALSSCQKELKDVYKGTKGYGYNYAPLDKVYDEVRPKMTKHGLSLTHQKSYNADSKTIELHSMLMHESGQWIEYSASLPFVSMKQMNDYQASGSGFTYLERYQTSAIFAITSDEDNDAHGEQQSYAPPPSKATANEQKILLDEFKNLCDMYRINAKDFIIAKLGENVYADKKLLYKEVRHYMQKQDILQADLEAFAGIEAPAYLDEDSN